MILIGRHSIKGPFARALAARPGNVPWTRDRWRHERWCSAFYSELFSEEMIVLWKLQLLQNWMSNKNIKWTKSNLPRMIFHTMDNQNLCSARYGDVAFSQLSRVSGRERISYDSRKLLLKQIPYHISCNNNCSVSLLEWNRLQIYAPVFVLFLAGERGSRRGSCSVSSHFKLKLLSISDRPGVSRDTWSSNRPESSLWTRPAHSFNNTDPAKSETPFS